MPVFRRELDGEWEAEQFVGDGDDIASIGDCESSILIGWLVLKLQNNMVTIYRGTEVFLQVDDYQGGVEGSWSHCVVEVGFVIEKPFQWTNQNTVYL